MLNSYVARLVKMKWVSSRLSLAVGIVLGAIFLNGAPARGENDAKWKQGEWTVFVDKLDLKQEASESAPNVEGALKEGDRFKAVDSVERGNGFSWLALERDGKRVWVPLEYVCRAAPARGKDEGNLPYGEELVDHEHGLALDYQPSDLAPIDKKYCFSNFNYRLRTEAAQALVEMIEAAKKDGHEIQVVSSYRSAAQQRENYLNAIKRDGAKQDTVAKPGHSEHQLGTTVDLVGGDPKQLLKESFGETAEGKWLAREGWKYGFIISYTKENSAASGYAAEPWHLRYHGKKQAAEIHEERMEKEGGRNDERVTK
ncbi:MAG: M15 family metallopeptidase [bacterium]